MKRSAICRLLIQALLFAGSALSVFWLAGGFDRDTAKRKRSVISTPPGGSQRVAKGKLSALSGAGSTADFIAGLRGAGVDEMRQAFLTTHNHTLRSAIVARWAALDPAGCFACMQNDGAEFSGVGWGPAHILFEQWARVDTAGAIRAMHGLDRFSVFYFAATASIIESCAAQGGAAWQAVLDDPLLGRSMSPPVGTWMRLSQTEDSTRNTLASSSSAFKAGRYGLGWLSYTGGIDASPEAIAVWKSASPVIRSRYTDSLVAQLAKESPDRAAAFLSEIPAAERERAADSYAKVLTAKDPAAAWEWINDSTHSGRVNAAKAWAATVPGAEGSAVLSAAPPSRARDTAAADMARLWMEKDSSAAAQWLQSIEDPDMKRAAWRGSAGEWVKREPQDAVAALTAPGAPLLRTSDALSIWNSLKDQPELCETFTAGMPPHIEEVLRQHRH